MNTMTDPEVYESVKRWLTKLEAKCRSMNFSKSSTKRAGLYALKRYCKFLKTDPESLIKDRMKTLESTNEMDRRKHEEYIEDFIIMLRNKEYAPNKHYAPNTIATTVGMIRSFYKSNYTALIEVSSIRPYVVTPSKVPTLKEVAKMCKRADIPIRAWILSQFNSGLANIDLLALRLSTLSSEFGTIKTQLRKGIVPIHIEIRRHKTQERTDTFFGPNAIDALNDFVNLNSRGTVFGKGMSERTIQKRVKALGIRTRVATQKIPITPYCLRRAFNTLMKLGRPEIDVPGMNEALVERMMGHSIGRVRSAYLITGRDEHTAGIPISKLAEIYMKHYPAIDITKV